MDFIRGSHYLIKGFGLILKPGLRRYIIIPLGVNALVFIVLLWIFAGQFSSLIDWLLPEAGNAWVQVAASALWLLFAVASGLLVFFAFSLVANFIGAPFNGLLSEKVEAYLHGKTGTSGDTNIRAIIQSIWPTLKNELIKLAFFSGLLLTVLITALIPVLNIIFPLLWALMGSWLLSLEYLGYPMENHGLTFKAVRRKLKERRSLSMGFGIAVMVATLLPVLNFLIMPAATAGATALWVDTWSVPDSGRTGQFQ